MNTVCKGCHNAFDNNKCNELKCMFVELKNNCVHCLIENDWEDFSLSCTDRRYGGRITSFIERKENIYHKCGKDDTLCRLETCHKFITTPCTCDEAPVTDTTPISAPQEGKYKVTTICSYGGCTSFSYDVHYSRRITDLIFSLHALGKTTGHKKLYGFEIKDMNKGGT